MIRGEFVLTTNVQVTLYNGGVLFDLSNASVVTRTEAGFLPGATVLSFEVAGFDHAHLVALTNEALQFALHNDIAGYDVIGKALVAQLAAAHIETARAAAAEAASEASDSIRQVALMDYLYGFQRAGVSYAIDYARVPGHVIIGDMMGLGKSAQGLATVETREAYPAVFVVPAGGRSMWLREVTKLLPHRSVQVLTDQASYAQADISIVSYDSLSAWSEVFGLSVFKGVVFDEIHRIKSMEALRTMAARRLTASVPLDGVVLGLTGTVVLNRPAELIEPLKTIAVFHLIFGSEKAYRARYCSKSTTTETLYELNRILRANCYIRRDMEQVLDDFPILMAPMVHLIDILPGTRLANYRSIEADVIEHVRLAKGEDAAAKIAKAAALVRLGMLRHEIGRVKVAEAITWTEDFVTETGRSLIVFAWHADVQDEIAAGLEAKGITTTQLAGGMTDASIALAVDGFQAGEFQVIVCSLQAASELHTLTAASDVLFAELPWTPAMYDQAVARARRIGQTAERVFIHNLLVAGTIDTRLAEIIDEKRIVTEAVTDGDVQSQLLASLAGGGF